MTARLPGLRRRTRPPLAAPPRLHTPAALDLVRDDWRTLRPLVEWLARHCQD